MDIDQERARIIARGEQAARLLSDPLLREVLDGMKTAYRDAFFDLPPEASEAREQLHKLDCVRRQFENTLAAMVDGATVERNELLLAENMAVKAAGILERVRNG